MTSSNIWKDLGDCNVYAATKKIVAAAVLVHQPSSDGLSMLPTYFSAVRAGSSQDLPRAIVRELKSCLFLTEVRTLHYVASNTPSNQQFGMSNRRSSTMRVCCAQKTSLKTIFMIMQGVASRRRRRPSLHCRLFSSCNSHSRVPTRRNQPLLSTCWISTSHTPSPKQSNCLKHILRWQIAQVSLHRFQL